MTNDRHPADPAALAAAVTLLLTTPADEPGDADAADEAGERTDAQQAEARFFAVLVAEGVLTPDEAVSGFWEHGSAEFGFADVFLPCGEVVRCHPSGVVEAF